MHHQPLGNNLTYAVCLYLEKLAQSIDPDSQP